MAFKALSHRLGHLAASFLLPAPCYGHIEAPTFPQEVPTSVTLCILVPLLKTSFMLFISSLQLPFKSHFLEVFPPCPGWSPLSPQPCCFHSSFRADTVPSGGLSLLRPLSPLDQELLKGRDCHSFVHILRHSHSICYIVDVQWMCLMLPTSTVSFNLHITPSGQYHHPPFYRIGVQYCVAVIDQEAAWIQVITLKQITFFFFLIYFIYLFFIFAGIGSSLPHAGSL